MRGKWFLIDFKGFPRLWPIAVLNDRTTRKDGQVFLDVRFWNYKMQPCGMKACRILNPRCVQWKLPSPFSCFCRQWFGHQFCQHINIYHGETWKPNLQKWVPTVKVQTVFHICHWHSVPFVPVRVFVKWGLNTSIRKSCQQRTVRGSDSDLKRFVATRLAGLHTRSRLLCAATSAFVVKKRLPACLMASHSEVLLSKRGDVKQHSYAFSRPPPSQTPKHAHCSGYTYQSLNRCIMWYVFSFLFAHKSKGEWQAVL